MATLADIRKSYPDYADMSDDSLADALHTKFYADMPRSEFNSKVGYTPPAKQEASTIADVGQQALLGFNRGLNDVIGLPGEIAAAGVRALGFPDAAEALRWNNPASRAVTRPDIVPETTAGRYAEALGRGFGASAIPEAGIMAAVPRIAAAAPAASVAGQVVQNVGRSIAADPAAAVAGSAASITGASLAAHHAAEQGAGPVGQTVAGIIGGVTPAGIGAATSRTSQAIRRARANQGESGAYGSMVDDIGRSVSELKDEIATGGSRGNVTMNRRTLDVLGQEMEAAAGDVPTAQAATIRRLVAEDGVTPQTAADRIRRLTSVHEDSNLMLGEYPAVSTSDAAQRMRQSGNVDLDELGRIQPTATQNTIDYLANKGSTQSAVMTRDALIRRQEELSPAMRHVLEEIGPQIQTGTNTTRPMTIQDAADAIDTMRRVAGGEYRSAVAGQTPFDLSRILNVWDRRFYGQQSPLANEMRQAVELFQNRIQTVTPTGAAGPVQITSTRELRDFINRRTALNDMIDNSYNERGQATALTRELLRFKNHVDHVVGRANPMWRTANDRWADMRLSEVARDLGESFSTKANPLYRQQIAQFRRLAPEAQDLVRIEFLQKLYDKLDNLGDTHSLSKLFANDHSRNMIRQLFGDPAVVSFTRAVRDQKVAEVSQAALGNSKTEMRRETKLQKDADTGLIAAAQNANVRGVRNWIAEKLTQALTERRNRPLSRVLTTPMSDTASVARHLYRMGQQEARMARINAPRARVTPYSGPVSEMVAGKDDGTNKILAEAKEAIRRGASRAQVIRRLKQMKIEPRGI